MVRYALVGDVSAGTTRFALVNLLEGGVLNGIVPKLNIEKVVTKEIKDFTSEVIVPYLAKKDLTLDNICQGVFAPAGVIENDGQYCKLTNGDLTLDTTNFGFPARLVNDFAAKAKYVAEGLRNGQLNFIELRSGAVVERAPIVVAGVGSGYGVALLRWDNVNKRYEPVSTELSHGPLGINLGDRGVPSEEMIFKSLALILGVKVLSWEDLLSTKKGGGIEKTFEIISYLMKEPLTQDYKDAKNKAEWVHVNARSAQVGSALDKISRLEWEMVGRSLRSFAVGNVARGGIYLTSGMAQNNIMIDGNSNMIHWNPVVYLENGFSGYSAHEGWSKQIPVRLIAEKEDGLYGAAYFALDFLGKL